MIKTLIVDDEPHARRKLSKFVQEDPDLELVAACRNGFEAIDAINRFEPDIVFLDIQMPELSGFDLLTKLETGKRPYIVFTTAHSEYAAQAFEIEAVDYLLKPFDGARFVRAASRAKSAIMRTAPQAAALDLSRLSELLDQQARNQRVAIKVGNRVRLLSASDIAHVRAEKDYLRIATSSGETLRTRASMKSMEERMTREGFVRIHRSILLNANQVKELRPKQHGDYEILMADGARFVSGASYRANVRRLMSLHALDKK